MTEVEERARQLLDAARSGHDPSAADAARVRAGLRARVLAEPMLIEPGVPPPRPSGLVAKLLVAFGAGGSAGFAAGFVVAQAMVGAASPATATPASATVTAPVPSPLVDSASMESESSPAVVSAATATAAIEAPAPPARRASAPRASDGRRSERVLAEVAGSASALKAELDGLRRAQELLYRGDAAWALARLDELDRAQGSTLLLEERTATRVIAECVLGKGSAARVSEFARQFPNSAHLERVRASCAATNGNEAVVSPVPSGRTTTERD